MPDTYRVLVTGSRNWRNSIMIRAELDAICDAVLARPDGSLVPIVLVHGACPSGADAMASDWCRGRAYAMPWYFRNEPHPANWQKHGKAAGFRRNAEMVGTAPDICLAFIMLCTDPACRRSSPHGTHGASNCAALAEAAQVETRRFGP